MAFVLPIVAGREEEWRRLLQELEGSRSADFGRMRRRLGIGTVRVWLQRTRYGELAVFHVETEDAARTLSVLADSEGAFERWLKRRVEELHGVAVTRAGRTATPELVFPAEPEQQGRSTSPDAPNDEGSGGDRGSETVPANRKRAVDDIGVVERTDRSKDTEGGVMA